jgi:glycosyltransferase involved in cell wall biosynthesis
MPTEPLRRPKILLISVDEFSGVTPALQFALQRAGCEVTYVRQSLHELGWKRRLKLLRIAADALMTYGREARSMLWRTEALYDAMSQVSKVIVDRNPQADVVVLIAANSNNYYGSARPSGKRFTIYTDYTNLQSKSLPEKGFALPEKKTHPRWNELERRALLAQDRIFVMGSHVKPEMVDAYGISAERITVIGAGPGIDLDIERDAGIKDPATHSVLFVGKEAGKKGLGVLLKAFEKVHAVLPDAILNVVTGEPVSGPGVVFHGKLPILELKKLFYRSNVFCMPAFKEPFGLVFTEAMWSKNACIGTRTGSMPELIQEGETGYLIEPGDHEALAERIITMLRDPETTKLMGERGYRLAKERFNWDVVAERLLAAL